MKKFKKHLIVAGFISLAILIFQSIGVARNLYTNPRGFDYGDFFSFLAIDLIFIVVIPLLLGGIPTYTILLRSNRGWNSEFPIFWFFYIVGVVISFIWFIINSISSW